MSVTKQLLRARRYPHILFIYMRACEHCLAGEIRGFFISLLLLGREWMRVLPVVYQTDHLLVSWGGGGSWGGERRHVHSPIKEARASLRQGKNEEDAVKEGALSGRRKRGE